MPDRMRADGGERVGCESADFLPAHHRIANQRGDIDAMRHGRGDDGAPLLILRHADQRGDQRIHRALFVRHALDAALDRLAVDRDTDAAAPRHDGRRDVPPGHGGAINETGRDIDGEGRARPLQHRIGVHEIVAVAVVEGKHHEAARILGVREARRRFVEIDDIHAAIAHAMNDAFEKFRCDFEMRVRAEARVRGGADVVKHQDRAASARPAPEQRGRAAGMQPFETRADDEAPQRLEAHVLVSVIGLRSPHCGCPYAAARAPRKGNTKIAFTLG